MLALSTPGTASLVLEKVRQYTLNVHLRINVFHDASGFTRTELGIHSDHVGFGP